jgi:hypothetical protein
MPTFPQLICRNPAKNPVWEDIKKSAVMRGGKFRPVYSRWRLAGRCWRSLVTWRMDMITIAGSINPVADDFIRIVG